MKLHTLLVVTPLLAAAMPSTRSAGNGTGDLFTVIGLTGVVAGISGNPFSAAQERFWMPDNARDENSCPVGVTNCPKSRFTVIKAPSTLDSTVGNQKIYVDPVGALRFLPANTTEDAAPPGSIFETFHYQKSDNPLLGAWFLTIDGQEQVFFACQNTSAHAFSLWQVFASVPGFTGFSPNDTDDCIPINPNAGVYSDHSPAVFEYV